MLKIRIITGALLCIMGVLILLLSHIPWFLGAVIACFCAQSIFELYRTTGAGKNKALYYTSCTAAVVLAFLDIPQYGVIVCVAFIAAVALFSYLMLNVKQLSNVSQGMSMSVAAMMVCFYKTMANIREGEQGLYMLAIAILVCIITDIAAYCVGKGIGRHPLAPTVSPKKTIEGSVGGILFAVAGGVLIACILESAGLVSVSYGKLALYLLFASVIGQFGDLSLSSVKRICGVKDYGALLPGHGGLLDRFDSLLFVLPFTYLFTLCAGPVFL